MSKIKLVIVLIILLVGGIGSGVYLVKRDKATTPKKVEEKPVVTKPQPLGTDPVAEPEPSVTNGYVIGVLSVSKSINGQSIKLSVINDGPIDLELNPDAQFKLVGLTDQTTRLPIAEKTTADFKGKLAKNAELTGTITFDVIAEQTTELRFYPDLASQNYVVVPLITLTSEQQ